MAKVTGDKIWLDGRLVDWDAATVHVLTHTLHYGLGGVRRQAEAPLAWTVSDFALVDSLYGLSRHEVLARWPLVARQQSFTGW